MKRRAYEHSIKVRTEQVMKDLRRGKRTERVDDFIKALFDAVVVSVGEIIEAGILNVR